MMSSHILTCCDTFRLNILSGFPVFPCDASETIVDDDICHAREQLVPLHFIPWTGSENKNPPEM